MKFVLSSFITLLVLVPLAAGANYSQRTDVQEFIQKMVTEHDFDRGQLTAQFASAKKLDGVIESISRPAEKVLTWKQYRPIFITNRRITGGNAFLREHEATLKRAEKEFGVPADIITAIIGVETYYGKRSGKTQVFDSLVTLGFDYPPRASFFRKELEQFLLLTREEGVDVKSVRGSYAGAMGMPQFISSSYRHYAIDFDGDGKRDLWNNTADAIGSVANYFKHHGWMQGEQVVLRANVNSPPIDETRNKLKPHTTLSAFRKQGVRPVDPVNHDTKATLVTLEGRYGKEHWLGLYNFYVITRYNHSALYAMAVYELSQEFSVPGT